ncbi:MFS transporter [Allobranchiibius sp. CTAmp26]|uniref:MFS transporter n=1 Tax=Allobranchiibius sp. CTAmp26 TaxID=2815214 RepID=UPI001AA10688|nr:MFS transporter [Allobranchiibius sp. CTAmp26]MBO1753931.1 MFS transporter [Allobranchiibius sp. CTAmp26]
MFSPLHRPAAFVVAGAAATAIFAGSGAPSPIYPLYQQLWHFTPSTLTFIFAVYVFALLAALLTVGSLSDHIGRRPVAVAGLLVLAVSMGLFIDAHGTGGLIAARIVQGLATGATMGAISALIVDQQATARHGSVVTSSAPVAGIALGSAFAGALVQWAPAPRLLVYWVLLVFYLALALLLLRIPDAPRTPDSARPSVWRTLRPSVGVPGALRSTFLAAVPMLCATWALGGLYLSLGSSVVARILGVQNHFVAGLVVATNFAAGAIGAALVSKLPQHRRELVGFLTLSGGLVLTIVAILLESLPLYVVGAAIGGLGFGSSFLLILSGFAARTEPEHRSQVFSATYIVSYVAFSIPAVVAGFASQSFGLRPTVLVYAAVVLGLVLLAAVLARRTHLVGVAAERAAAVEARPVQVAACSRDAARPAD